MAIVTATTQKREKERERRDGRGERRVSALPTNVEGVWGACTKGCSNRRSAKDEGVKRGATATGGQEDGRATSNIREQGVRTKERMAE
jgi:hypothetical protein